MVEIPLIVGDEVIAMWTGQPLVEGDTITWKLETDSDRHMFLFDHTGKLLAAVEQVPKQTIKRKPVGWLYESDFVNADFSLLLQADIRPDLLGGTWVKSPVYLGHDLGIAEERPDAWKVIGTDNFNRDEVSDNLVAENMSKENAEFLAKVMNDKYCVGDYATTYYLAVNQAYRLARGMMDLV